MGVPSFFRWLSQKYPKIVIDVIEDKAMVINGVEIPLDTSQPNPNNIEFDNLYLDMNGIIHPCTHPEDGSEPSTEEEMIERIMSYVDRLFAIVRPRRLLFLAIDGVAPRAKMNQQRSRRFRTAKEAKEKREKDIDLRNDMIARGITENLPKIDKPTFDSNCITPGTLFMEKVAKGLIYYVHERQTNDPGWKNIKVLISDSNVPGEGEHKIMELIRNQRTQQDYDPNQRHVICGLDADLIMLGLATHEPHFYLLRENVFVKSNNNCFKCDQPGHRASDCTREPVPKEKPKWNEQPFQFLTISVLREYLSRDLRISVPFGYDFERIVDDFVFLCFFVGNDFIPHLPTLEIREGAIDLLLGLYRSILPTLGDYLTKDGEVNLENVEKLLRELSPLEDSILQKRRQRELQQNRRERERKRREQRNAQQLHEQLGLSQETLAIADNGNHGLTRSYSDSLSTKHVRAEIARTAMSFPSHSFEGKGANGIVNNDDDDEDDKNDPVKLGESGWHERYYDSKFGSSTDMVLRRRIVSTYVEGLCWVMRYYYQGCCSWNWFFPFHFAPFANDLTDIRNIVLKFEKGRPFKPLMQLMGVLPPASCALLPRAYGELMTNENSPIIDYYPEDFEVDMNGKKMAWLGVVLLPFMDEKRLVTAVEPLDDTLTYEEMSRNTFRTNALFINARTSPMVTAFTNIYRSQDQSIALELGSLDMNLRDRLFGRVGKLFSFPTYQIGETVPSPLSTLPHVSGNNVLSVAFYDVQLPAGYVFASGLLEGAEFDEPVLASEEEYEQQRRLNVEAAARMIKAGVNAERERTDFRRTNSFNDDFRRSNDNIRRSGEYNSYDRGGQNYERRRSYDQRGGSSGGSSGYSGDQNNNFDDRPIKRPRMSDSGGYNNHPSNQSSNRFNGDGSDERYSSWSGPRRGGYNTNDTNTESRYQQRFDFQEKNLSFDSFGYSSVSGQFNNPNPFSSTSFSGTSTTTTTTNTTSPAHTLQLLQQLQAQLQQEQQRQQLQQNNFNMSQNPYSNRNAQNQYSVPQHLSSGDPRRESGDRQYQQQRHQQQQQYQSRQQGSLQHQQQKQYDPQFKQQQRFQIANQNNDFQNQNQNRNRNQFQSQNIQSQQQYLLGQQMQQQQNVSDHMRNPNPGKRPYPQQQQQQPPNRRYSQ